LQPLILMITRVVWAIGFELWRLLYFFRIGKEGDRLGEVVGDRVSPVVQYRVTEKRKNVTVVFSDDRYASTNPVGRVKSEPEKKPKAPISRSDL
jgi:hypothetical protein